MTSQRDVDYKLDTMLEIVGHRARVQAALVDIVANLQKRSVAHDLSKLDDEEFWAFAGNREEFKKVDFGTPEYAALLEKIKPAIDRHYSLNDHHTGYNKERGYRGMSLLSLLEMAADWHAASVRSKGQGEADGLKRAFEKYEISEEVQGFVLRTYLELGWMVVPSSGTPCQEQS